MKQDNSTLLCVVSAINFLSYTILNIGSKTTQFSVLHHPQYQQQSLFLHSLNHLLAMQVATTCVITLHHMTSSQ